MGPRIYSQMAPGGYLNSDFTIMIGGTNKSLWRLNASLKLDSTNTRTFPWTTHWHGDGPPWFRWPKTYVGRINTKLWYYQVQIIVKDYDNRSPKDYLRAGLQLRSVTSFSSISSSLWSLNPFLLFGNSMHIFFINWVSSGIRFLSTNSIEIKNHKFLRKTHISTPEGHKWISANICML